MNIRSFSNSNHKIEKLLRFFGAWYFIWFAVGLFSIGFGWKSVFFHVEDLLFMLLASAVLFLDVSRRLNLRVALISLVSVALVSGVIEYIGAKTGFPFGEYAYTERFGPRLLGTLPLAIPFAWFVIVMPLHIFWSTVFRRQAGALVLVPLLVGVSATCVDFALEPVATQLRAYWLWAPGDALYYGVPGQNFLAWFGVATLISFLLNLVIGHELRLAYQRREWLFIPLGVLLTVLLSFLVGALINQMWLASMVIVVDCALLFWMGFSFDPRQEEGQRSFFV